MVAAASRGDAAAWRSLVEAYQGRVYGLIVRQCGDRDLAEEITQATFVKLVSKLGEFGGGGDPGEAAAPGRAASPGVVGRYEERGRFEPWLFRVAMNGLRDEMRRRKRQAVGTGGDEGGEDDSAYRVAPQVAGARQGDMGEDPLDLIERTEQVERLRVAVAELGEADREVLHLRHTAGLSFAEIAETLGQPLGTVLARAHRALGKLRKRLEAAEVGEGLGGGSGERKPGQAAGAA